MAASLPTSTIKAPLAARVPASPPGAGLSTASIRLPLRFMLTGMLALAGGVIWLFACPEILSTYHYNPHIVAVTHLFTLGWITTIIMGALYQLAPVALETQLYSERLARWQYWMHVIGIIGMVWMFWIWRMEALGHFGALVGASILLFIFNLGKTLRRVPSWNLVASGIASALGWFLLTMLAGLYLAAAKC